MVLIIEKRIASEFIEGTVTHLNLAFRLTLFFSNALIFPLGTVLLPKMAKVYWKSNTDKLYHLIYRALLIVTIVLFIVLITVLLNAKLITYVIYKPVGLTSQSIAQIASYLRIYAISFLGLFYYLIMVRLFYSTQHINDLLKSNLIGLGVYILFVYSIKSVIGSIVLPLGYALFYLTNTIYLYWRTKRVIFKDNPSILNGYVFISGLIIMILTIIITYYSQWIGTKIYQDILLSSLIIASFLLIIKRKTNISEIIFNKMQ
jgi:peptidoglycan biosynthesis protein MviN/MurJ (putative lipid II flippase)